METVENCRETGQSVENSQKSMLDASRHVALTLHQRSAFDVLAKFCDGETEFGMALLEGFAGTGKTTLVGELVRQQARADRRIAIAAPTNKAVRVLKEKVETQTGETLHPTGDWDEHGRRKIKHAIEYGSIHSFLGLKLNEHEDGTQECKQERDPTIHEFDLVIVDECSMLADDLVQRIALGRRRAKVLFVGDPAQLPPVGDSSDISPVFSRVTYRATLTEVVRQARDNPIIRLSIAIRKAMEQGDKISLMTLGEALPMEFPAKAGIMQGGQASAISAALYEIEQGRDARIIAYLNTSVMACNRAMHEAIHGYTEHPYVVGERVIAHQPFQATALDEDGEPGGAVTIINSEELVIERVSPQPHFIYRDKYPCCRVVLKRDNEQRVACYVADDHQAVERDVGLLFAKWRQLKTAMKAAEQQGHKDADKLRREAAEASGQAWALRKAFAPLRHAYALTTHKSQGSTFDTAIVDFNDLARMRSAFEFNRALYVAATRGSEHLAIVA